MLLLTLGFSCRAADVAPPRPQAAVSAPSIPELTVALVELAERITHGLSEHRKSRIAINEFSMIGGERNAFGVYVAEELASHVVASGGATVVDRRFLRRVLAEQEIGASQLVDDATAAGIGKIVGADTLCTGTVTDHGPRIRINAVLLDTETAEVFGAATVDAAKNVEVADLLRQAAGNPLSAARTQSEPVLAIALLESNDGLLSDTSYAADTLAALLIEAGLRVTSSPNANYRLMGTAQGGRVAPPPAFDGFVSYRVHIEIKLVLGATGEIVAAAQADAGGLDPEPRIAFTKAVNASADLAGRELIRKLSLVKL